MIPTDISYSSYDNKLSAGNVGNARASYKIFVNRDEPIVEVSLGKAQRGGQGLGRKHRVRGFYIDSENRVYAEYAVKHDDEINGSGSFYQYAIVGRLYRLNEEDV